MKKWFSLLLATACLSAHAQKTYIQCGSLIDGISNTAKTNMTIVVEGNKIVAIENGFKQGSSADKIIDLKNKTVTPGWMDMHVHLEDETSKSQYLDEFT